MTALLLLLGLAAGDLAPAPPPGSSSEFQNTAYRVEDLLSEGKFDQAETLVKRLPDNEVTYSYDDSKVPDGLKGGFRAAMEDAVADWAKVPDLKLSASARPKIKISFEDTLPAPPGGTLPAGAVFFVSDSPEEPRVEAVIAVRRETPPTVIDPRLVQNEVGYAIGAYLGLARFPRPVGYMGRLDSLVRVQLRLNPQDKAAAVANLSFSKRLREAVAKKERLEPARPDAFFDSAEFKGGDVSQGDPLAFSFQVTNRGKAPLSLKAVPDCGCVGVSVPATVEPGQTSLIKVGVDTSNVWGPFRKGFVVFTNDPDSAERRFEITAKVRPWYRFLSKNRARTIVVDEGGAKQELFLAINPAHPFKVTGVKLQGTAGVVDFEPWEGPMEDPDMDEGALPRKGYKISFLASPTERDGRVPVTINATTDLKDLPYVMDTVYLQWGIITEPQSIYFGEVGRDTVAFFLVTRPGKPFRVKSVDTDSEYLKASALPYKEGDYRVQVTLSSKAPAGSFRGKVTVHTDDAKQPTVEIPVSAMIK